MQRWLTRVWIGLWVLAAAPAVMVMAGLKPGYLHTHREFPFDAALRDIAATTDVATATWVAKTLEYPVRTELAGAAWPWGLTARALAVGLVGVAIAAGIGWFLYRRPPVRHFVRHAFEMFVAMMAGMMLLGMVWSMLWPALSDRPDADALVMAFNMTIGMGLWMWIRGHNGRVIAEMGMAMVAPFVVLLVPFYLGLLSGDGLMVIGHTAMVLAMLAVMLLQIHHYTQPHGWRSLRRRPVEPAHSSQIPLA